MGQATTLEQDVFKQRKRRAGAAQKPHLIEAADEQRDCLAYFRD